MKEVIADLERNDTIVEALEYNYGAGDLLYRSANCAIVGCERPTTAVLCTEPTRSDPIEKRFQEISTLDTSIIFDYHAVLYKTMNGQRRVKRILHMLQSQTGRHERFA